MKHALITRSVIGCAFEVIIQLGADFLESVYTQGLQTRIDRIDRMFFSALWLLA
ncbi:MAG TPA: GxxExxY protein [Terriglobia bacterium]|nr:GxxExxY protein [Terriglobia bacterium]